MGRCSTNGHRIFVQHGIKNDIKHDTSNHRNIYYCSSKGFHYVYKYIYIMRSLNALKSRSINNDTLSKNRISFALNQTATTGASLGSGGGGTSNVDLTAVGTNIVPTTNGSLNLGTSDKRFATTFTDNINLSGNIMPVGNLVSQIGDPTHWFGNIYVNHISCGNSSISIGGVTISANNGAISIPAGATIGGVAPGTIQIKGALANTGSLSNVNAVPVVPTFDLATIVTLTSIA